MSIGKNVFLQPRKPACQGSLSTKTPSRLNDIGVGLLVMGHHKKALKVLTRALTVSKVLSSRVEPGTRNTNSPTTSRKPDTTRSRGTSTIKTARHLQRRCLGEDLLSEPIILGEEELLPGEGRSHIMKLSCAIIYNLALVHQAISLCHKECQIERRTDSLVGAGSKDSALVKNLAKTLRLYELSFKLQHRERIVWEPVHSLARLNNMAHIHSALGNERQAHRYFLRLQEIGRDKENVAAVGETPEL